MGRATWRSRWLPPSPGDFYPRPPWGGRLGLPEKGQETIKISIHALRGEGDPEAATLILGLPEFLSTPSVGRATFRRQQRPERHNNFYPRPPWGGRPPFAVTAPLADNLFLSTPSVGRATTAFRKRGTITEFLSTPSVGRATSQHCANLLRFTISIHALRGEGDFVQSFMIHPTSKISIHALRGEGDKALPEVAAVLVISIHALRGEGDRRPGGHPQGCTHNFYPRPPWGGRLCILKMSTPPKNFYPRPPWGGRPAAFWPAFVPDEISIHALRGEGDGVFSRLPWRDINFYPRPPWGGRLRNVPLDQLSDEISIHALRGEGDMTKITTVQSIPQFLSTPSVGRATRRGRPLGCPHGISIHALRGEGDLGRGNGRVFRPISIHALRGEGDGRGESAGAAGGDFYPRPPWGGRRERPRKKRRAERFLSTPSVGRATIPRCSTS